MMEQQLELKENVILTDEEMQASAGIQSLLDQGYSFEYAARQKGLTLNRAYTLRKKDVSLDAAVLQYRKRIIESRKFKT